MGITGLLPYLKKIHTPVNISQFEGCTVAVDAYCWLHKGAFSCADKLALGETTDQYVHYCMKYVNNMLKKKIRPILVFDGCRLPSKKDVEKTRRERRETNRKKAAAYLREGKRSEAKECLQRSVDVTSQMALRLMNACREQGVDCIVAPYEADAQLAYLNKIGVAQIVVTEDSDLLLFGCDKVIFKMDVFGNGILVEHSRLNEVLQIRSDFYTFDKFRYMCILSGCDYLASLPGIGLAKANKVFKMARQPDLKVLLSKLPSYLKMKLVVTQEYIDRFVQADNTFLYQLVFDPVKRTLIPLNPYPPEVFPLQMDYAGPIMDDKQALQIALGNIDTTSGQRIGEFVPAKFQQSKCQNKVRTVHIWNSGYDVQLETTASIVSLAQATTEVIKDHALRDELVKRKTNCKRKREAIENQDFKSDKELTSMYDDNAFNNKKSRYEKGSQMHQKTNDNSNSTAPKSPVKDRSRDGTTADFHSITTLKENKPGSFKRNMFAVQSLSHRSKLDINEPRSKVYSRYFSCKEKNEVAQRQRSIENHNPETHSDIQTLNDDNFQSFLPAGSKQQNDLVSSHTASDVSSTKKSVSVFNWSKSSGTNLCCKEEDCVVTGAQAEDIHDRKTNEDLRQNAKKLTSSSLLNRGVSCSPIPRNSQKLSAQKAMSSSDRFEKDCRVSGLLKTSKSAKQTNLKEMFSMFAFKK
ncbi:exonuclease 1-like isoform X1 [Haliotis rufescens]|uniref:exonuclease 1-like isoform X1 n=2 Tax=Haliotis rufescens TaxID=6454 RepID=UPI001EAF9F1C|nr:exonuclease 1-like isoform X1 [Haliotis rufescens]